MFVQSLCIYSILCTRDAFNREILEDSCMDEADIRILDALQNDGRLANNDLAEKVGLSPSQCSRVADTEGAVGEIGHGNRFVSFNLSRTIEERTCATAGCGD